MASTSTRRTARSLCSRLLSATQRDTDKAHQHVFAVELDLLGHVREESADHGRQVDHMCRSNTFKNRFGGLAVAQIAVLARQEDPRRVLLLRRAVDMRSNSHAVEARAAGDHADDFAIGFGHFGSRSRFCSIFG